MLLLQAGLLRQTAPTAVVDAFIRTRFGTPGWGRVAGALDSAGVAVAALLAWAYPVTG